jgi:hypothetical protein
MKNNDALAIRHAMPTIYFQREFAEAGVLIGYGPSFPDSYRQAGIYAGRILKGEKPGELPVQRASKFDFVINLKNRQDNWYRYSHYAARPRRRGDRMTRREFMVLGARFRNIWNGRWWVHVRFCSVRCEGIYEVRRNEAAKHRWHTFLAHSNSRS